MKILAVSDEECSALWEHGSREKLREYDLIISCGDLKSEYLSYLVTMARCPVIYVHGNHDTGYRQRPPEGCDCIDDRFVLYNGLRILGLGGCLWYHPGAHQYTDKEMARRIRRLRWQLWRHKGVDIVVTHAPPKGYGDDRDNAHQGFSAFLPLLEKYHPAYLLHGHVHFRRGLGRERKLQFGQTQIINVSERYVLEIPERECTPKQRGRVIFKNKPPRNGLE